MNSANESPTFGDEDVTLVTALAAVSGPKSAYRLGRRHAPALLVGVEAGLGDPPALFGRDVDVSG